MNEREQKRMYLKSSFYSPPTGSIVVDEEKGDTPQGGDPKRFPWVYYLLGGKNEQFAVYYGMGLWYPQV